MGIRFSVTENPLLKNQLQDFDGMGLDRPTDLPCPTLQSHKKLIQLLLANHHNYNVLCSKNRSNQNILPHVLVSLYYLGATPAQLYATFEILVEGLTEWEEDSPQEVTLEDWQDFIGNKSYSRGFLDFYQEKIQDDDSGNDWKKTAQYFLTENFDTDGEPGSRNLLSGIFGGSMNALIHLGYASELDNWELASEALTLASTEYCTFGFNEISFDHDSPKTLEDSSDSALELLNRIQKDSRFDSINSIPLTDTSFQTLIEAYQDTITKYTKSLNVTFDNIDNILQELLHMTTFVGVTCYNRNRHTSDRYS